MDAMCHVERSESVSPSVELDSRGLEPWRRQREKEKKKRETWEGTRTSDRHLRLRDAMAWCRRMHTVRGIGVCILFGGSHASYKPVRHSSRSP